MIAAPRQAIRERVVRAFFISPPAGEWLDATSSARRLLAGDCQYVFSASKKTANRKAVGRERPGRKGGSRGSGRGVLSESIDETRGHEVDVRFAGVHVVVRVHQAVPANACAARLRDVIGRAHAERSAGVV